jgi:hypothetical protein
MRVAADDDVLAAFFNDSGTAKTSAEGGNLTGFGRGGGGRGDFGGTEEALELHCVGGEHKAGVAGGEGEVVRKEPEGVSIKHQRDGGVTCKRDGGASGRELRAVAAEPGPHNDAVGASHSVKQGGGGG